MEAKEIRQRIEALEHRVEMLLVAHRGITKDMLDEDVPHVEYAKLRVDNLAMREIEKRIINHRYTELQFKQTQLMEELKTLEQDYPYLKGDE